MSHRPKSGPWLDGTCVLKPDPFSKEHICSRNMHYLSIINLFIVSLQPHCILMLGFPKDLKWQNLCHWQKGSWVHIGKWLNDGHTISGSFWPYLIKGFNFSRQNDHVASGVPNAADPCTFIYQLVYTAFSKPVSQKQYDLFTGFIACEVLFISLTKKNTDLPVD